MQDTVTNTAELAGEVARLHEVVLDLGEQVVTLTEQVLGQGRQVVTLMEMLTTIGRRGDALAEGFDRAMRAASVTHRRRRS